MFVFKGLEKIHLVHNLHFISLLFVKQAQNLRASNFLRSQLIYYQASDFCGLLSFYEDDLRNLSALLKTSRFVYILHFGYKLIPSYLIFIILCRLKKLFNGFSRGGAENIALAQNRYYMIEHGPERLPH